MQYLFDTVYVMPRPHNWVNDRGGSIFPYIEYAERFRWISSFVQVSILDVSFQYNSSSKCIIWPKALQQLTT